MSAGDPVFTWRIQGTGVAVTDPEISNFLAHRHHSIRYSWGSGHNLFERQVRVNVAALGPAPIFVCFPVYW